MNKLLFWLTITISLAITSTSCSDHDNEDPICGLPVPFNFESELTGLVVYDSIKNTPSIIIESSEVPDLFLDNDSIYGMTLFPYKGSFFNDETTSPELKDGEFVKVRIEQIYGFDGPDIHYVYATVRLSYAKKNSSKHLSKMRL